MWDANATWSWGSAYIGRMIGHTHLTRRLAVDNCRTRSSLCRS